MKNFTWIVVIVIASFGLNCAQMYKIAKQDAHIQELSLGWSDDAARMEAEYDVLYDAHKKLIKQKSPKDCWTKESWFNGGK